MSDFNRRNFFKTALGALIAVPLSGVVSTAMAAAKKCGKAPAGVKAIKDGDKAGKRLAFEMVGTNSKHNKYKKGDICGTCKFYKDKKAKGDWAPCNMLANKYVPSCGWCKSFKLDKNKVAKKVVS